MAHKGYHGLGWNMWGICGFGGDGELADIKIILLNIVTKYYVL